MTMFTDMESKEKGKKYKKILKNRVRKKTAEDERQNKKTEILNGNC